MNHLVGFDPARIGNGMKHAAHWILGSLLVANLAVELSGRSVFADGNPATNNVPQQIPYNGTLELDGAPFNGQVRIRFEIFDGPGDAAADWSGEYDVAVYNGAFSVLLGPGGSTSLPDILANADNFQLGMTLLSVGGVALDTPVALTGRQALLPVPFALHAQEAADFAVNRDLLVARNADVTGTTRLRGAVTADSSIAATGALSGASLSVTGAATVGGAVTAASADINGAATAHSLTLDGASNFIAGSGATWAIRNGATNAMTIETDGDVNFARSISVARGIAVAGPTFVQPTPASEANIYYTDGDDLTAFATDSYVCANNAIMRGVQTARQNFTLDFPAPIPDLTIPVFVVRPVCAPAD